jgi:hypothetical protein
MDNVITFRRTAESLLSQAIAESGSVYYDRKFGSSRAGNYRYKATRRITPWNKVVKAAYPDGGLFEAALEQ